MITDSRYVLLDMKSEPSMACYCSLQWLWMFLNPGLCAWKASITSTLFVHGRPTLHLLSCIYTFAIPIKLVSISFLDSIILHSFIALLNWRTEIIMPIVKRQLLLSQMLDQFYILSENLNNTSCVQSNRQTFYMPFWCINLEQRYILCSCA